VAEADVLDEAAAELYMADPEEFVQRRGEWVARARAAGQAVAARKIGALRKPTRSAWVVNRLARTEPEAADRLTALGEKLRAAERARDGGRLRELSRERRELIATLLRQALAGAGQHAAPAAMREEITATFAAALADPDIAGQVREGVLVRPARRPGFGTLAEPMLTLVPPLDDARAPTQEAARPGAIREAGPTGATPTGQGQGAPGLGRQGRTRAGQPGRQAAASAQAQTETEAEARAEAEAQAEAEARAQAEAEAAARAEAERERQRVRAEAERALAAAEAAVEEAGQARQAREDTVRRLEEELNEAHRLLHEARAKVRQSETEYRKARQALGRLPGWE
jgi:chemotaxis protein histidine kinase CheA